MPTSPLLLGRLKLLLLLKLQLLLLLLIQFLSRSSITHLLCQKLSGGLFKLVLSFLPRSWPLLAITKSL